GRESLHAFIAKLGRVNFVAAVDRDANAGVELPLAVAVASPFEYEVRLAGMTGLRERRRALARDDAQRCAHEKLAPSQAAVAYRIELSAQAIDVDATPPATARRFHGRPRNGSGDLRETPS